MMLALLAFPWSVDASPTEEAYTIEISPGDRQDVYLHLGIDNRPDLLFNARLLRIGSWPDDEGLELGIVDPSRPGLKKQAELRYTPAGRTLTLSVASKRRTPPGTYPAVVRLSTTDEPSDGGKTRQESIRLNVLVKPAASGAGAFLLSLLGTLLLALVFYFSWVSLSHSRFLSPARLADCLQPLKWNERCVAEPYSSSSGSVLQGRIAAQLRWQDRLRGWFKANPLVFGLHGRVYEETARIVPGRKQEDLYLEIVAPRGNPRRGMGPAELAPGSLYVRAALGGGLTLLGIPSADGRLGGLVPDREPARDRHQWNELTLLTNAPEPGKPAGWKINTVRIRSTQRVWSRRLAEAGK